mmetsp:Transcript_13195/g.27923  ORF Transcript_13195/g.27923 Transcript_13195/m.27923 type:complete len:267 (-) Transcript_13195:519-1319(-)
MWVPKCYKAPCFRLFHILVRLGSLVGTIVSVGHATNGHEILSLFLLFHHHHHGFGRSARRTHGPGSRCCSHRHGHRRSEPDRRGRPVGVGHHPAAAVFPGSGLLRLQPYLGGLPDPLLRPLRLVDGLLDLVQYLHDVGHAEGILGAGRCVRRHHRGNGLSPHVQGLRGGGGGRGARGPVRFQPRGLEARRRFCGRARGVHAFGAGRWRHNGFGIHTAEVGQDPAKGLGAIDVLLDPLLAVLPGQEGRLLGVAAVAGLVVVAAAAVC